MSAIIKKEQESFFRIHVKGSPEKIRDLCIKTSVPKDFDETLMHHAMKGYRIIALAYKELINVDNEKI